MGIRRGIVRAELPADNVHGQQPSGKRLEASTKVHRLALDLDRVVMNGGGGAVATERPIEDHNKTRAIRFAGEALTERTRCRKGAVGRIHGSVDRIQQHTKEALVALVSHDLPPWFRTKQGGSEKLTSEQSLNQMMRRELVSRDGPGLRELQKTSWKAWAGRQKSVLQGAQEPDILAVYHSRWAAQQESGVLPRIKVTSPKPNSRNRTHSSQLFKSRDPVAGRTFGVATPGATEAIAGWNSQRGLSEGAWKKRQNLELLSEHADSTRDRLGMPLGFPQNTYHSNSQPSTSNRPGTSSLPVSSARPNTQARIAQRVEEQRKQDLPEPAPVETPEYDNVDTRAVLHKFVSVACSGRQELIEESVPQVLEEAAQLCRQNRYIDAERLYRAVLQYSPSNATALCNLGIIVERVHDNPAQAASFYEQALEITGDQDTTCLIHLARAEYRGSGDISKSRKLLRKVLAIDPTHSGALSNMALLLLSEWVTSNSHIERIGKMDSSIAPMEALTLARQAATSSPSSRSATQLQRWEPKGSGWFNKSSTSKDGPTINATGSGSPPPPDLPPPRSPRSPHSPRSQMLPIASGIHAIASPMGSIKLPSGRNAQKSARK